MRPRVRRLFSCATLILYGAVSLGGFWLHALPGCGHNGCCQADLGDSAPAHDHSGHDHDHATAPHSIAAACVGDCPAPRSEPPRDSEHDHDDCLICQFWARAQLPAPPPPDAVACGVALQRPARAALFIPSPALRLYDTRGPPLSSAC